MHSGTALSGVASPRFRTGRYSKVLPARMIERYAEAAQDGELLTLREDIALVDTRLVELLSRLDTGETGAAWRTALDHYAGLQDAIAAGDAVLLKASVDALGSALRRGQAGYSAWAEIAEMLDLRRRLVESERKRLVQLSQMVTVEQAMVLLTAVVALVREHVDDQHALARISDGIRRLTMVDSVQREVGDAAI